jgi:hypothetical protein
MAIDRKVRTSREIMELYRPFFFARNFHFGSSGFLETQEPEGMHCASR